MKNVASEKPSDVIDQFVSFSASMREHCRKLGETASLMLRGSGLRRISSDFSEYFATFPLNIQAVEGLQLSKLADCAEAGIAIWRVPRTEVIEALLSAS